MKTILFLFSKWFCIKIRKKILPFVDAYKLRKMSVWNIFPTQDNS